MAKLSGSCLCGSIKYSVDADPIMTAACHCKDCQKQTGTAYSVIVGVPAAAVSVDGDTMKTFVTTGQESHQSVNRHFCGNCGSPLMTNADVMPELTFIKGGTLDDPSCVEVGAEIWCDSRASTSVLGADLPKMPGNPPG
jgi:hypothetical protein